MTALLAKAGAEPTVLYTETNSQIETPSGSSMYLSSQRYEGEGLAL